MTFTPGKYIKLTGLSQKTASIRTKLVLFTVSLILIAVVATMGPAFYFFADFTENVSTEQTLYGLEGLKSALEEHKKDALNFGTVLVGHPGVVKAIEDKDANAVLQVLGPMLKQGNLDFATITDETGKVIVRTHEQKKGDHVTDQANVKSALGGTPLAAVEPGTVVKLSARAGIPVKNEQGRLVGVISLGYYITRNELVDEVKQQYGTDVTLFSGDTRVATTIVKDGQRVVGTKLNEKIAEKVLQKGQKYVGWAEILGHQYVTAYMPLLGPDNKPVGVLFAGKSAEAAVAARNHIMLVSGAVTAVVVLIVVLLTAFVAKRATEPINRLVAAMGWVAAGDLTKTVNITAKDEFGALADGYNAMIEQLKLLITQVNASAATLTAASQALSANGEQSAQAAGHVADTIANVASDTVQQTSAVAQTSAVVEAMAANVRQVAANAGQVAGLAGKTADAAREGDKAIESAVRQMGSIEKSVEHSVQVVGNLGQRSQEIGQIVEMIAGIAAQTNLLALNAAIEAARAGEQGRGFAVVAEEVRKLAEQSEHSAKQIGELIGHIQKDTSSAVTAMSTGADEVKTGLAVVNEAGRSFAQIAGLIEEVLAQTQDISAATRQLADSSQTIVTSVRQIEASSQSIAGQTQTVSAATEEQMASVEEIASSSHALSRLAEELHDNVQRFKV